MGDFEEPIAKDDEYTSFQKKESVEDEREVISRKTTIFLSPSSISHSTRT